MSRQDLVIERAISPWHRPKNRGAGANGAGESFVQRLFHERADRKADDWAGLLTSGSNYSLHLPALRETPRKDIASRAGSLAPQWSSQFSYRLQRRDR